MTSILVESSPTPIYDRIARSIGEAFAHRGCEVRVVHARAFDAPSFAAFLASQGHAIYVSNNSGNRIQQPAPEDGTWFFESFPGPIVFVHQDAMLHGSKPAQSISKLQAWRRVDDRAVHLCIEPQDADDLRSIGVRHAVVVPHASERVATPPSEDGFRFGATFVGHALPQWIQDVTATAGVGSLARRAVEARKSKLSTPIAPMVDEAAVEAIRLAGASQDAVTRVAIRQWLRDQVHVATSLTLRGWLIEACQLSPLTVFGGDPAYLHGVTRTLNVERPGLDYRPAEYDPATLGSIYRDSWVSLNLSALQFDHAVVNRVHDVFLAGGLCLTDARSGLRDLTDCHEQFSFCTLDELRERALYFADPRHVGERASLIRKVQADLAAECSYGRLADRIEDALSAL